MCVYYMTGAPEGSPRSGFMEKPGIEPATPGLQDIGLSPTPRRPRKIPLLTCLHRKKARKAWPTVYKFSEY